MVFKRIVSLSNLTLLVALALSTVAAYYSIIGLTAIFAGAVIPIIVMGSILEVGKITTTVWLRKYWKRCSWILKLYLVPAVVLLALLTSMGIFGFLSKAHMDQGLVSGDSQAKLSLYDEKIRTQRDNIELARKALQQMDAQVDARLSRGDSENGAERAVQIRRQQQGERAKLQKEIGEAQKEIAKLNEERAPIAAENRKVEAEVGPVKYIAALIYGDNADQNMLEAAVRWVIILLVIVFDPLAIALVLAANASKEWDNEEIEDKPDAWVADVGEKPTQEELDDFVEPESKNEPMRFSDPGEHPKDNLDKSEEKTIVEESLPEPDPVTKEKVEPSILEQHPYLLKGFTHFQTTKPLVYVPEQNEETTVDSDNRLMGMPEKIDEKILSLGVDVLDRPSDYLTNPENIITEGVTKEAPLTDLNDGYVLYEGKHFSKQALKEIKPELFMAKPDDTQIDTKFGTEFPKIANKGDMFIRVDILPNRVYKFDGRRWIEINKTTTDSYLFDQEYIKHLVNKISTGEYDIDLLTENEKSQVEEYLKSQNS